MTVTVYGHSDDLIEVTGDLRAEFAPDGDPTFVAFGCGVVLRVLYTDEGVWEIRPMAGADQVTVVPNEGEDSDNYSDRVTVLGDATWVVFGTSLHRFLAPSTTTVVTP